MSLFSFFKNRKIRKNVNDLSNMFPKFLLMLAKGVNGTNRVHDSVANHPDVLGFMYGFALSIMKPTREKLGFDDETMYFIIYQAIADTLNRSDDMKFLGYRIIRYEDAGHPGFVEHQEMGQEYVVAMVGLMVEDERSESVIKGIQALMGGKVYEILEENGQI